MQRWDIFFRNFVEENSSIWFNQFKWIPNVQLVCWDMVKETILIVRLGDFKINVIRFVVSVWLRIKCMRSLERVLLWNECVGIKWNNDFVLRNQKLNCNMAYDEFKLLLKV